MQAMVMISSVVIVALFGISDVGGLTEVWNRAVEGGRIFYPEYDRKEIISKTIFFKAMYVLC